MNTITTARTFVVAATFAVASITFSSCGSEIEPPAQDIGGVTPEPSPRHFEPACNTRAAVRPCPSDAPTGGTRNRMRFDDELEPQR
jgi:hypothetical protein